MTSVNELIFCMFVGQVLGGVNLCSTVICFNSSCHLYSNYLLVFFDVLSFSRIVTKILNK